MNRMYNPNPDGYCGDEDNGQTSAWYVFSALGFYPVTPGVNQYVLGAPLFKKITLTLENGNKVVIEAGNNSAENRYVESLSINGKLSTKNWISHEVLQNGATLQFKMTDQPNQKRGIHESDYPYSFSTDKK